MTVHYDRDAPGQSRIPVNAPECGSAAKAGDTATAAPAYVTCSACVVPRSCDLVTCDKMRGGCFTPWCNCRCHFDEVTS